jgi:hypothetical protein
LGIIGALGLFRVALGRDFQITQRISDLDQLSLN